MKHRIAAILTALSLCTSGLPVFAQGQSVNTIGTYFGIKWDITDGVLTLSGEGDVVNDQGFPDDDSASHPNWGYRDRITKIVIGDGITYADAEAFRDYPVLETVVLPENFPTFSAGLFQNCPKLREIEGIEQVEYFNKDCLSGTAMTAESPFVISDGKLQYCDISEPTDIIVPDGVTSIGRDAFGNLADLMGSAEQSVEELCFTITLPDTVKTIDDYAFANLTTLTSVNLPERVKEIGDFAFFNCVRLDSLTLGENLQQVGDFAFFNCKNMESLTVLSEDTELGKQAFGTVLDSVGYLQNSTPEYTEEQIQADLELDPCYYDVILHTRLDWYGTMNYLYAYENVVNSDWIQVHTEVPESSLLSGYINSPAHYSAVDTGLRFSALDEWTIALGDANADTEVNALDASIILAAAANTASGGKNDHMTAEQRSRSDVNADGAYNAMDAALILQYAAYAAAGGTDTFEEFLK